MTKKLWDGRFVEKTHMLVEKFTSSIDFDNKLHAHDIRGSMAHCEMLAKQGIISNDDAARLIKGLEKLQLDIINGDFHYDDGLEDIHMHIESALAAKAGKVANKLHTARSRNDQVCLDIRMYLKDNTLNIIKKLIELRHALVSFAKKHIDTPLPGYTHTQRAQPVLLAHHMMAYYEMFSRDTERFRDALKRIDVMPLGAAALAGTTHPIDREFAASLLGFSRISKNSMDTVSDRDFIMEFLADASITMVHLSRISEEMILWASAEFDFIEISDAFTTGSSIMPQKKNPDVAELVRGKTGRVFGDLMAVLTLMKGLPLAYNRDMQEDKEPLFDAAETLTACIEIYAAMLPEIRVKKANMRRAAESGFLNATDFADHLVKKGMAFRDAHNLTGKVVAYALESGRELHQLTLEELNRDLKNFSESATPLDDEVFKALSLERVIERRISAGGTAGTRVAAAVKQAEADLSKEIAGVSQD